MPEMNVLNSNKPSTMASPSQTPAKSALSLQLEQFDRGTHVSTENTLNVATSSNHGIDYTTKKPMYSNERLILRKISKMISDERWLEMDALLRSPAEMAAHRSDSELSRSPTRWQKTAQGNHTNDAIGLTSSMNNLSIDMASMGGNDLNPMQVVHYACRFNPPRTIISHLASLYPQGVMLQDKMGRLPLHYAAKWGASYRLLDYLIEKDRSAASVKDSLGKTPLHLLCEHYSSFIDSNQRDNLSSEDNMMEAMAALIEAAPDAVNIEDNDDTTAIEYAIASDTPYDAVRLIQKASERDWKERKKTSMPGETHLKIEEKLVREQQQRQKEQGMDRETEQLNIALPTKKPKTR
eukprot:CAMPEP_0172301682 /NCGR_PEP_ID=MMETSP1058-20130122/3523_1 /TAXON_ID=83371 /ORGANISM="Detonula confervacea, Strain CCMP 353" /LENGTH=350 /DNA_ID=CAMNT_0013011893 /DNA_START=155 /DNA_END=1204 /DNA_ORIENTATION=+